MADPARKGNTPALKAIKTLKADKEAARKNPSPSTKMFVVVGIGISGLVIVIVLRAMYVATPDRFSSSRDGVSKKRPGNSGAW